MLWSQVPGATLTDTFCFESKRGARIPAPGALTLCGWWSAPRMRRILFEAVACRARVHCPSETSGWTQQRTVRRKDADTACRHERGTAACTGREGARAYRDEGGARHHVHRDLDAIRKLAAAGSCYVCETFRENSRIVLLLHHCFYQRRFRLSCKKSSEGPEVD